MTKSQITAEDIQGMINHWLSTPVGSYLGSDYGSDIKSYLQAPLAAGMSQSFIAKMQQDIPLIKVLPSGVINIYVQDVQPDKRNLIIEVAGKVFVSDGDTLKIGA